MAPCTVGLLLAAAIIATAAAQTSQPANWETLFIDNFEDATSERWQVHRPEGSAGQWQIEYAERNYVFSGEGVSWVTLAPQYGPWWDFRLKARVKLLQGAVSVNFRVGRGAYAALFHSAGLGLRRETPGSGVVSLAEAAANHSFGQWYLVEIIGAGANLRIHVAGVLKIDFTDPAPVTSGTVGFEAHQGSRVHVDDVEISAPSAPAGLQWVKTGGPIGGVGYDVRMRSDNPDIMYVTDTFSGVNMSTDGGRTWSTSNGGILGRAGSSGDAIPVFCLTIGPHNPDVIWVGTQDKRGIYKSPDGGRSWIAKVRGIVEQNGISFRGVTVDPRNPNVVYAAAEISSAQWAGKQLLGREFDLTKGVVYRTLDGGENWTAIWRGDNLARYIWIDPRDSNVIYVSTGIFDREAANSDVLRGVPGGVGIAKSTDGGRTWRNLNEANGLASLYISSLFMHPSNPGIFLAGAGFIGGPEQSAGVYLSTDAGEHWHRGVEADTQRVITALITSVEFATSDPQIAYAAGPSDFYRSSDGGRTWRPMSGGPPLHFYGPPGIRTGHPVDLQVDPRRPDRVFINNYGGGNFLSEDGGRSWRVASKGYTGAQILGVAVDPRDARRVFAIARSGIFRSLNAGDDWEGINYLPPEYRSYGLFALNPHDPDHVLVSSEGEGLLFQSRNAGRNWTLVFRHPMLPPDTELGYRSGQGLKALAFAPSNPSVVYGGMSHQSRAIDEGWRDPGYGLLKSADGGKTWREANDAVSARQNVNSLVVDPRSEDVVYAGTVSGGVLQTLDGGRSWRVLDKGLPSSDVRALAINPANPLVIYAGLENRGVYKTLDAGTTWRQANAGMDPQAPIRDIVIDPTNPQVLYAADLHTGVYRSEDGGKLWLQINRGLSTRAVNALAISSDGGMLYAATQGEGVFRLEVKPRAEAALAAVSAASFVKDSPLAPESIASLFGTGLAAAAQSAASTPLPVLLAEASVSITDSGGVDRWAPLFFASAGQINCQIPAGTATGTAMVRVLRQNRVVARGQVRIEPVAPALFTANADGKGAPAAVALRIAAGGSQTQLPVFTCGATCTPAPIDLGAESDQVILLLFGTGIRGGKQVSVRIGGLEAPVLGFAAQGQFAGLDQVNIRLPRALAGRGEVDVALTVDGKAANVVKVRIQ